LWRTRNAEDLGRLEFTAISTLHRKIARLLAAQNAIDNLRPTKARKRWCERRDTSLRQGDAMRRDFRNGSFASLLLGQDVGLASRSGQAIRASWPS
jgi:hypothetical protein